MIRAVSVAGFHGAGKTKVVVGLVRELTRRKLRVGTVKHITERDFTIDKPGKDTWLHARAGARVVVSVAPREIAQIEKRAAELDDILQRLYGLDFVVVEGFRKSGGLAKIVVARNKAEASKLVDEFTIACVGVKGLQIPTFGFGQVKRLADLVEKKAYPPLPGLDCERCGYKTCKQFARAVLAGKRRWDACPVLHGDVFMTIDGKRIPLNPFVQEIFANIIYGMVSSLRGTMGGQIEIKVIKHAR